MGLPRLGGDVEYGIHRFDALFVFRDFRTSDSGARTTVAVGTCWQFNGSGFAYFLRMLDVVGQKKTQRISGGRPPYIYMPRLVGSCVGSSPERTPRAADLIVMARLHTKYEYIQ